MRDILRARAAVNGGYLRRGEILDAGYQDSDIRAALADDVLVRIRVGTYAFRDTFDRLDAAGRHRITAFSVLDRFAPHVALSYSSACAVWGVAQFDTDLSTVHVSRLDRGRDAWRPA